MAIYDDRVNRLRVTSISVTGIAADNSRTRVSFHRSLTAMVTRPLLRTTLERNQDYINIWTLAVSWRFNDRAARRVQMDCF